MKLESISKIFGVLAFVSFALMIVFGIARKLGDAGVTIMLVGMPVIFLLGAILTTLKRIALAAEGTKKG